jgi:ABC-2 type transport system ATP-binding protein
LAQAIIHDPQVLILDEPTSGLDPNQLAEIRDLIKTIGKSKTVMLSTHIMQEVEAICDRVVIINKGQIVANDKASILQGNLNCQVVYAEFEGIITKNILSKIPQIKKVEEVDKGWLLEGNGEEDLRKIIARYAQLNNLLVLSLRTEEKSLEDVFKELTQ